MAFGVGADLDICVFEANGTNRKSSGVQYGPIVDAIVSCVGEVMRILPYRKSPNDERNNMAALATRALLGIATSSPLSSRAKMNIRI